MIECPLMGQWVVRSIPLGGPIELFLASASGVTKAMSLG